MSGLVAASFSTHSLTVTAKVSSSLQWYFKNQPYYINTSVFSKCQFFQTRNKISGLFTNPEEFFSLVKHFLTCGNPVGGDRGMGARENRGREGYGRRERKGREAGVLRGREAGEKCETLFF